MINKVTLGVNAWSVWYPGCEEGVPIPDRSEEESKVAPLVHFLPAIARRRLSRLTKMALQVAHDIFPEEHQVRTVFASQHGELKRCVGLLQDLARDELLSPTAFSMSVHNSASGVYSIQNGNTMASTALAARKDSLAAAFLEAAALILSGRDDRVMVVLADEPLCTPYETFDDNSKTFALALLLTSEKADAVQCRLSLSGLPQPGTKPDDSTLQKQQSIAVAQLLQAVNEPAGSHGPVRLAGERFGWEWQCHAVGA